jgi:hypothetical protein
MFPAQGAGAPQQPAAPPQPSPWQPQQQQGFAPPQQQGFQPPRPPQQQGFQPPPPPSAPPNPYGGQQPPNPYAQPAPNPYAQPAPNPYAQAPNPYAQPPQGQAPNPYQPQPVGPAPSMAGSAPKKVGKGLIIGVAAAGVLAVAGGVIAFVMLRGGGGASGGDSRDAVVKATLAAMADGSVDDLLRLSDPEQLYAKMVDCEGKTPKAKSDMDRDDEDDKELSQKDKDERDPKKVIEKQKKEFGEIVKLTKGAKIELVEIIGKEPPAPSDDEKKDDDDDGEKRNTGFVVKRGQRLMKGCVAKAPLRITEVKLKVKVTPAKEKEAIEQETEMMMMQVGKGWWLLGPPTISVGAAALIAEVTAMKDKTCACKDAACAKKLKEEFKESPRRKELKKQIKALPDEDRDKIKAIDDEMEACDRKLGGGEMIAALAQFKDKMCACQDKTCAEKVSQEMMVWAKSHADDDSKPDTDTMKEATELSEQMSKCMMKAYEDKSGGGIGATIGEAGGVAGGGPSGLPQSCTDYRNYLEQLTTCSKIPQASRDAFKQSLKTMDDAWGNLGNMDASGRKAMDDACRQGLDATKQATTSLGC